MSIRYIFLARIKQTGFSKSTVFFFFTWCILHKLIYPYLVQLDESGDKMLIHVSYRLLLCCPFFSPSMNKHRYLWMYIYTGKYIQSKQNSQNVISTSSTPLWVNIIPLRLAYSMRHVLAQWLYTDIQESNPFMPSVAVAQQFYSTIKNACVEFYTYRQREACICTSGCFIFVPRYMCLMSLSNVHIYIISEKRKKKTEREREKMRCRGTL